MVQWPCTQIGQQRIATLLDLMIARGRLHPAGARAIGQAKNWQGALIVLRYLNSKQGGSR